MPKKLTLNSAKALITRQKIEISNLNLKLEELEQHFKVANSALRKTTRKLKAVERLATRDTLTGLLNERGGEEVLSRHFSILSRDSCAKNNFAVLYLDLDRFKGINDLYGHDIGDEALKFFARRIVTVLRNKYDIVIRVHGDEFVIVLPECNSAQAEIVKAKIKNVLAEKPFIFGNVKLSLRTSVGIAMALNKNEKITPLKKMLVQADKAMYKDKEKGRASRHA